VIDKYTRRPDLEIEIRRPNYQLSSYEDKLIVVFGQSDSENVSTACIGYSYSESLNSLDTPFSLNLTLERDGSGYTWYDKIHVRDLVFIKEHGKTRFAGFITDRRYQARMGDKGVQRSITISGVSIGGFITFFSIIMDLHILASNKNGTAFSAAQKFMTSLAGNIEKDQQLSNLILSVFTSFFDMIDVIGQTQQQGIRQIVKKFFDVGGKFSSDLVAKYPVSLSVYQTGENSLWNILQQIITPPFHEFYGLWNYAEDVNKYELILRQTPFDPANWSALPIHRIPDDIPALFLQDYDIGDSDRDAKTVYGCFLPGSAYSREKVLTLDNFSTSLYFDKARWPYYGYKSMFTELRFFNRSKETDFLQVPDLIQSLSNQLYNWFNNNIEFLTGTVTIMNVESADHPHYPQIGQRLGFLEGEFYIEEVRRSWQYGGSMTATLSVSRGFMYSSTGEQRQPIDKIGQKIGVLEKQNA
jgi:hypothetical protein